MNLQVDGSSGETKPFLEHLNDLRNVIIYSVLLLLSGVIVVIPFMSRIMDLVFLPLLMADMNPEEFLHVLSLTGGFNVAVKLVLWSGVVLSAPFILIVVGRFVFPALTNIEKKAIMSSMGFAVVLFFTGVLTCYFTTLPVAIKIMLGMNNVLGLNCEFIDITSYIAFVLRLLLVFGLAFELPVIVIALASVGLVNAGQLKEKRPYVWVALMIMAMFLTPPDPVTQVLLALPLALLYEFCIWSTVYRERKKGSGID